jgi:hypothetical protein
VSLDRARENAEPTLLQGQAPGATIAPRTSILEGQAVSSMMAGAPAQEEIDEPTGKFLRPRGDIAYIELLAELNWAN